MLLHTGPKIWPGVEQCDKPSSGCNTVKTQLSRSISTARLSIEPILDIVNFLPDHSVKLELLFDLINRMHGGSVVFAT